MIAINFHNDTSSWIDIDAWVRSLPPSKPPKRYSKSFGCFAIRGMEVCGVRKIDRVDAEGNSWVECCPLSVWWPAPKRIGEESIEPWEVWMPS